MPDMTKLITMADLFGVTLDELVRGTSPLTPEDSVVAMGPLVAAGTLFRYEYKSKTSIFGIPLVHICTRRHYGGGPLGVAKGIIAIGDVAIGVLALGAISVGLLSIGAISVGLLFALGGIAVGGVALGGFALGVFALGGVAIAAIGSFGGAAIAGQAAGGGGAFAPVATGGGGSTDYGFFDGAPMPDMETFIETAKSYAPHAPRFFLRLLHYIGTM